MKASMLTTCARRRASMRRGGRSIGPAIVSDSASSATVPPFTTNWSTDPATKTSDAEAMKATSAPGLAVSAETIEVAMSRRSPRSRSLSGVSSSSATRKAPPTIGTASSSLTLESATNPTMTSGQLAAAMSAPRFRAAFRPGAVDMAQTLNYKVYSAIRVVRTRIGSTGGVTTLTRERRVTVARVFGGGCGAALLVLLIGAGFEVWRLGASDHAAAERVQRQVRESFAAMTADVERLARGIAADPAVARAMAAGPDDDGAVRLLFDAAGRARQQAPGDASELAATIYDTTGDQAIARAWVGRASDLLRDRSTGSASLFVTPSPLGLRLVYLQPIDSGGQERARLGAAAVEHVVTPAPAASVLLTASEYEMPTSRGPVSLRLHTGGGGGPPSPDESRFVIQAPDGTPLLDASVQLSTLADQREGIRRTYGAIAIALVAVTILLLSGPLLDARATARSARRELQLTFMVLIVVVAGAAVLWAAFVISPWASIPGYRSAFKLLLGGLGAAGIVAALASSAVHLRVALRARRRAPEAAPVAFAAIQLACGIGLAALLVMFERTLGRSMDPAAVDLRHFSLHPWTTARLATLTGILLSHAAVLWLGALACVTAAARWRFPRGFSAVHAAAAALWVLPIVAVSWIGLARGWTVPALAVVLGAIACAISALLAPRLVTWYRRATVASRILALFVAFLLPALLVYPSVHYFSEQSIRRLVETRYAVEAMNHPQALQDRLRYALSEIDALPNLPDLVRAGSSQRTCAPNSDTAFRIWSQTVMARARLTSDLEIYDEKGALLSRFGLNVPEYTSEPQKPESRSCRWETVGEAIPLGGGAQERNTLHAQRSVCVDGRPVATLVVHVIFDFRTLPFITSQSAYYDVLGQDGSGPPIEGSPAGDVDIAVYGWGLTTLYMSGEDAWPLDEDIFRRVYQSRDPFWTVLRRNQTVDNVYFVNDRQFIYALGYATSDVFDHFVRLAELTTLAAVGYVAVLIGAAIFSRIARQRPPTGRPLLREIRASF